MAARKIQATWRSCKDKWFERARHYRDKCFELQTLVETLQGEKEAALAKAKNLEGALVQAKKPKKKPREPLGVCSPNCKPVKRPKVVHLGYLLLPIVCVRRRVLLVTITGHYGSLHRGTITSVARSRRTLAANSIQVRPTALYNVTIACIQELSKSTHLRSSTSPTQTEMKRTWNWESCKLLPYRRVRPAPGNCSNVKSVCFRITMSTFH